MATSSSGVHTRRSGHAAAAAAVAAVPIAGLIRSKIRRSGTDGTLPPSCSGSGRRRRWNATAGAIAAAPGSRALLLTIGRHGCSSRRAPEAVAVDHPQTVSVPGCSQELYLPRQR